MKFKQKYKGYIQENVIEKYFFCGNHICSSCSLFHITYPLWKEPTVTGGFTSQRVRIAEAFVISLNKLLNK